MKELKDTINFLNELLKDTEDELLKQDIRVRINILITNLSHSVTLTTYPNTIVNQETMEDPNVLCSRK